MPHEYKTIPLVDQMVKYLPFDARAGNLFEERVSNAEAPAPYDTKALHYVLRLLADDNTRLIVLTGDAGHGKTHLCRRILQETGLSADQALAHLKADPEGNFPIRLPASSRPARIIKDLSEFSVEKGEELLLSLWEASDTVGIVCVNEGRLREVVSRNPQRLGLILETLEDGLRYGHTASRDMEVHVINLNFQSVAPIEGGFLEHVLDSWTRDGRRWAGCADCAAAVECPIYHNKGFLGDRTEEANRRRAGLVQLVRTAEQTGYVLTIREALILVAYLVTGGLKCDEVHELHRRKNRSELRKNEIDALMFERRLSDAEAAQLGVLSRIRRFDPGTVPHRDIDEAIVRELEDNNDLGESAWFGAGPYAQSKRQRREEALFLRNEVKSGRRRAYFNHPGSGTDGIEDRARRMGLYHHAWFVHIQGTDEDAAVMRHVVNRVVTGIHVIQGIRPSNTSNLYLVDPAFSRTGSHTSVIALRIPKRDLWLWGLREFWQNIGGGARPQLTQAVDWLDRSVVLCRGQKNPEPLISLDLLQFEFVMRAADGVAFPNFHAADRRRILTRLAEITERSGPNDDEIRFVMADSVRRIVVERDGSFEVHGGD